VDSCFVLIGTRQHCVAKICNASPTANVPTHINCKMTRSLYQVPYFELTCVPKHALRHHVCCKSYVGSVYRMLLINNKWSLLGSRIACVSVVRMPNGCFCKQLLFRNYFVCAEKDYFFYAECEFTVSCRPNNQVDKR